MVVKLLVATIFLAAVACMGVALFYFASAMFSVRAEFTAKKRGYVLDLVPFLLLTPFAYNKFGRSYVARAICYGIMCGLLIFLSGTVAEWTGIASAR